MKAVLVAGGTIDEKKLRKACEKEIYIAAADSGADALYKLSISPNLLIGDFDSISDKTLVEYRKNGIECLSFPPEKDASDSELALSILKDRGYDEIEFFGALGGRLDHSVSNLFLTYRFYQEGVCVCLRGDCDARVVTGIHEIKRSGRFFSLFRIAPERTVVSIRGAKYDLESEELPWASSLGLSNEWKDDVVMITVHSGAALFIESDEANTGCLCK